jgi:hypothetical protein
MQLDLGLVSAGIVNMGLAGDRSCADGDTLEVIEDAGRCCTEMGDRARGSIESKKSLICVGVSSGVKFSKEPPSTGGFALPLKAVPASMPKLGSVTNSGCSTR